MDSADGPPPLEDMTELLQQVTALQEMKKKKRAESSEATPKSNGCTFMNGQSQKENMTEQTETELYPVDQKEQKESKSVPKTKQPENSKTQTNTKDSFGGMKKGFLFGGVSKSKAKSGSRTGSHDNAKTSKTERQKNKPEVKEPNTLEDIPFITKKEDNKNERFKFSEVQEAMEKTNAKLMENKDWVTDDFLEKLEKNDKLAKRLQNPMFMQAIGEFQNNPQEAMKKYGSNPEVQEFFMEFCGLMGQHFNKLAEKQGNPSQTGSPSPHSITTLPRSGGADMSVRSSTNPKQSTAADEQKMQEILSDPEIRDVLMDPKVQELFECLRHDPSKGQRLLQEASTDFRQKIQKLVNVGLLQFQ